MSHSPSLQTGRRIGFISTRFIGTDGVSLETSKWAEVLERLGHTCYYIEFDGYITDETVRHVRQVLQDAHLAQQMAEHNYQLATRHYSYAMLERRLQMLIADCFGEQQDGWAFRGDESDG